VKAYDEIVHLVRSDKQKDKNCCLNFFVMVP